MTALITTEKGGLSLQFALLLFPLLLLAGGSVDLGTVYGVRAALQNASDAASVGSITKTSPAYVAAQTMSGNGTIAAGNTDATSLFSANSKSVSGKATVTFTPAVSKTGLVLSSTLSWSATVP